MIDALHAATWQSFAECASGVIVLQVLCDCSHLHVCIATLPLHFCFQSSFPVRIPFAAIQFSVPVFSNNQECQFAGIGHCLPCTQPSQPFEVSSFMLCPRSAVGGLS